MNNTTPYMHSHTINSSTDPNNNKRNANHVKMYMKYGLMRSGNHLLICFLDNSAIGGMCKVDFLSLGVLKNGNAKVDIAVAVPALSVMGSDLLICATDDFVIPMSNAIVVPSV